MKRAYIFLVFERIPFKFFLDDINSTKEHVVFLFLLELGYENCKWSRFPLISETKSQCSIMVWMPKIWLSHFFHMDKCTSNNHYILFWYWFLSEIIFLLINYVNQILAVVGGGPAGIFGAIRAKSIYPSLDILVLEKSQFLYKVLIYQP